MFIVTVLGRRGTEDPVHTHNILAVPTQCLIRGVGKMIRDHFESVKGLTDEVMVVIFKNYKREEGLCTVKDRKVTKGQNCKIACLLSY